MLTWYPWAPGWRRNPGLAGKPIGGIMKQIRRGKGEIPWPRPLSTVVHKFGNVFIDGSGKEIYFPLTLTLSPIGGEGIMKKLR
jgi:uncharacterized protein YvpB